MSSQNEARNHKTKLLPLLLLLLSLEANAEKIRYFSAKECDRFSLDAVYNEKFKLITENIYKDCSEFVNSVADRISDSLTNMMAELPDRSVSTSEEKRIFTQFSGLKKAFSSRVQKMQKNITTSWETLVTSNFDLLYDNGKSSLEDYLNKTLNMADTYSQSKKSLDSSIESFMIFIKSTVRDGLQGISMAADDALKKEEAKRNSTEEQGKEENESEEDKLTKKKAEIAEMIVKGFLGKITIEVINRKIDLFKKSSVKPEDRDSVLDDLLFDILMIKNRIRAIIHPDLPKDKGSVDFARRSIYTYWADLSVQMYKEKINAKKSSSPNGDLYYRKLWSNEDQLTETLLNLMEVY